MKRFLALLTLALLASPVSAQPVKAPNLSASNGPLVIGTISLPQQFLQPETMRYALWATHQTRRRLDLFRSRNPFLNNERVEAAISAAQALEHSLKETLKAAGDANLTGDARAALSAEKLEGVRKSLAYFEAAASAPEVKTLLERRLPELGEERARVSLKQLSRMMSRENEGWPHSKPHFDAPSPALRAPTPNGGGVYNEDKPLRSPAMMELIWNNMPGSLAAVARSEYSRAYNEAYYDSVTGIHSRRYLDHHAAEYAEEDSHQLVGDIDHFKKVNDEMGGHQIGDATLKVVAQIWGEELAKADEVGVRWGGEEFWGRVRGGEEKAVAVAASINARVRAEVHQKIGLPKPLTISIGVAGVERKALGTKLEDFHQTFKRADDAVFNAKHQGRDRVVVQAQESFFVKYAPPANPPTPAAKRFLAFLIAAGSSLVALAHRRRE